MPRLGGSILAHMLEPNARHSLDDDVLVLEHVGIGLPLGFECLPALAEVVDVRWSTVAVVEADVRRLGNPWLGRGRPLVSEGVMTKWNSQSLLDDGPAGWSGPPGPPTARTSTRAEFTRVSSASFGMVAMKSAAARASGGAIRVTRRDATAAQP